MHKRIAIITQIHFAHGREIVRGLLKYGNEFHPDWHFQVVWRSYDDLNFHRQLLPFDAVVNAWSDPDSLNIPRPSIRVTSDLKICPGCVVDIDDRAVGQLAARYLQDQRVMSFASVHRPNLDSSFRVNAFNDAITAAGHSVVSFKLREVGVFADSEAPPEPSLLQLKSLPRPIGLFADTDSVALTVLQSLGKAGLSVPDDVLLLGVDNDQFVCSLTKPAISSIAVPFDRAGYLGGEMLDHFFSTGALPPSPPLLAPLGVVSRGSTERIVIEDVTIARAVAFIKAHAIKPTQKLSASAIADHVSLTVRTLQNRFRHATGRSLSKEISHTRVLRAKELLRDPDLSLKQIAHKAGFSSTSKMSDVFRRVTGITPTDFRKSGL